MDKKKVELRVIRLFPPQPQSPEEAAKPPESITLILGEAEKDGYRRFALSIGLSEAQAIVMELRETFPPRPMMYQLFAGYLEATGVQMMRALIYKVEEGLFYSYIYLKVDGAIMRMDARTSDAVLLALRMKAPIYVYEEILDELFKSQSIETGRIAPMGDALDPNTDDFFTGDSIELLEQELQKAIKNEDFERASRIRDEINNRRQQQQ
ncbi:MAG: bifunctional nuclease family protein [Prevotellaceae bacterium]|jgi:bifunctional DNase/RNase|nr:bifunctional nuclease family protein [Prevotellaceae bacterium]